MNEIKPGMKFKFAPTGKIFKIEKVTDSRVSWYTEVHKGGSGINQLKMAWTSRKRFQEGINKGTYKLIK